MVLVDCHRCHILLGDGTQKVEGRVVHNKKGTNIYLNLQGLRDARFNAKVIFYDDRQGVLTGMCQLIIKRNPNYPKMPEPWMAECLIQHLQLDEKNQRLAVRIKTQIELEFVSSGHGKFLGTIKDLSVGGLQLSTRQLLDRNERIAFIYAFAGKPRRYDALVIRGNRQKDGKFTYGCRFVNLTDGADTAIGGYLFKRQQELRDAD